MARKKLKWKVAIILYFISLAVYTQSLPIDKQTARSVTTTETAFVNPNTVVLGDHDVEGDFSIPSDIVLNAITVGNLTRSTLLRNVRPGQDVRQYTISITFNGNRFIGRAVLDVVITEELIEENLFFHFDDVEIQNVLTGVFTEASALPAESFNLEDGILEVEPIQEAVSYIVIVEYTGTLRNDGRGLYIGEGEDFSYIGMNLHPTYARRVFPCMDEPTEASTMIFTFNNVGYTNIAMNSILAESSDSSHQFWALQNPPHLWSMVAHNFINLNIPTTNVTLVGRPGRTNQDSQASLAINAYLGFLNEWTERSYFGIVVNQGSQLQVLALPDVDRDWHGLSNIGIWEPHILMETSASVLQRKKVLTTIAEAMSKQWFGYLIHPHNWRHQWVISGLASYAAKEAVRHFQSDSLGIDVSLLDVNTLFVTDIIQESLLRDAYISPGLLEPNEDIFDEDLIRDHINGIVKYKGPAIMHMLRLTLGDEGTDLIQASARALLAGRALQTVSTQNFFDAVNSAILTNPGAGFIENVNDFLDPWLHSTGYPMVHVGLRQGGVLLTQERFTFTSQPHINYEVPLTYTTSVNPNFENVRPIMMMDATSTINMALDEEDWVIFNIQGQGYYRVNYDADLWERIIEALEDPERREQIHPLNRATLVDDALNLARGSRLDYEIAFRVVLTMEHETEYAVWKAFVRNMDFLRKRLVALVDDDEDLDPDIYLRMVRRTIRSVEDVIGFYPDPLLTEPAMVSLTRGLVMDHACRANYDPCIAAAVDWFYDPNNNGVVNPNIPYDIRPAVYCTMVREGNGDVINALNDRLEVEASHYERVVILESMACSRDDNFILSLLEETITPGNRYLTEERMRIFKAVAESSTANAGIAVNFMSRRTQEIRNMYGGDQKLEELIFVLADNVVDGGMATDFSIWVNAQNNNLDGSQDIAARALEQVNEAMEWNDNFMDYVYEWIDENDAPTLAVSLVLVGITFIITLFNH